MSSFNLVVFHIWILGIDSARRIKMLEVTSYTAPSTSEEIPSLLEQVVVEETGGNEGQKVINTKLRKLLAATMRTNQQSGNWADFREEDGVLGLKSAYGV